MKKQEFIKKIGVILGVFIAAISIFKFGYFKSNRRKKKLKLSPSLMPVQELSEKQISFLLSRTTFGVNEEAVLKCTEMGMDKTIELLFTENKLPEPPINFEFTQDIYTPIGSTWVESPYMGTEVFLEQYRKKSLQAWIMNVIYQEGVSLREQMVLFWHNYFGVSDIIEHKFEYVHNDLLRRNAWGNLKSLVKEITIDPAMLHFLSGFENTRESPNENYARELLELFTIGKGELIAPGDYTTYTEEDVRSIACALTGWTYTSWYSNYKHEPIIGVYHSYDHDNRPLRLSKKFNRAKIPLLEEERYKYIIDIIFKKREVALNFCRKIYVWFVHYDITEEVETNIIDKLADILIKEDFEIEPVLKTLFTSNHFFDSITESPKIKNPVEYVFNTLKSIPVKFTSDKIEQYYLWHDLFNEVASMGLEYFKPPSVAGWKAYYQGPFYYKLWINAATLKNRKIFIEQILSGGFENSKIEIDYPSLIATFHKKKSFLSILEYFTSGLISKAIVLSREQIEVIRLELLGNLNEETWMELLAEAKQDNNGEAYSTMVMNIKRTFDLIFNMPEYNVL